MPIRRGEIRWADLGVPSGSAPGFRRPVLILQSDSFNESRIATVICAVLTSNLRLAEAPGNVLLESEESGLDRNSVVNVSQIVTLDKSCLDARVGYVQPSTLRRVEEGLRLVLDLE